MADNLTDIFVDYIFSKSSVEISEKVFDKAKFVLLDYFGVTIAGASILKQLHSDFINNVSSFGNIPIIGLDIKTSMSFAALLNGMSAHVTELDDGHRSGMIHLGSSIISAILAAAEKDNKNGREVLKGIIIGYEAAIILSSLIQPLHKKRGFHTSGTCGTIGAAIGVAIALNFDKKQLKDTLSLAATSAAGLLEIQEDASDEKPYNIGRAAMDGIVAAYMAQIGLTGPNDILGGNKGFFTAMTDVVVNREKLITAFCSNKFHIEDIYTKLHAACRHCHAPIDSVMKIMNKHDVDINNIEKILVETYDLAVNGHDHTLIQGVNSAKLSIPFSIALAIKHRSVGLEDYSFQSLNDKQLLNLTKKVNVLGNTELSALVPDKRAAIVKIFTKDVVYTERTDYPRGEPENPISRDELEMKFETLIRFAGKEKQYIESLKNKIWNL